MLIHFFIKLLILLVLSSQFSAIVHAVEHQFEEEEHHLCSICIHESESKTLLISTNKSVCLNFIVNEKIALYSASTVYENLSTRNARSPPSILI